MIDMCDTRKTDTSFLLSPVLLSLSSNLRMLVCWSPDPSPAFPSRGVSLSDHESSACPKQSAFIGKLPKGIHYLRVCICRTLQQKVSALNPVCDSAGWGIDDREGHCGLLCSVDVGSPASIISC